jgi:DNA-binding NarL/FixJ family response regulator
MGNIRVLLADDHAVVREGLKSLINSQDGLEVVGEADNGHAAALLATELNPDVVVADVSMPGLNGAQLAKRLREIRPNQKVLALTVHEDRGYLRLMMSAGAAGYVLKRAATDELVCAIRAVAAGETYIDPAMMSGQPHTAAEAQPVSDYPAVELSERETEVVRLIALGYSNKEIAGRLNVSIKTVETYKTRSMEKLNMRSRVDIVQYAARRGWLVET